ncbi:hypothetical protein DPMN_169447 [Dreissena polymorpha]|uniref:Uncharacterized protein n=1 Tax=Dreissena polymorpha TaxID=45954 RepID=A0A9D4DWS1_DREPO|nr:hypothetical protein DPMN_169447 [Dreissena polymorpha]
MYLKQRADMEKQVGDTGHVLETEGRHGEIGRGIQAMYLKQRADMEKQVGDTVYVLETEGRHGETGRGYRPCT